MRMPTLLIAFLLMFFAFIPTAHAEIIYFDDFDGPTGTDLDGTVPDITPGGEAWVAGSYVDADGALCEGVAGQSFSAGVPFAPETGKIYELSATVDNYGDWIGIGFLGEGFGPGTRFLFNSGPVLWALVRGDEGGAPDQAFIGPSTTGGLGDATTHSADELKVRIETNSDTEWVVTWYFDGDKAFQRFVNPTGLDVSYAAFGSNGLWTPVSGHILTFKLEEISDSTTAWEPYPENKAIGVPQNIFLIWEPGVYSDKHDVYVGTDLDSVNNATRTSHPGLLHYSEKQDDNGYPLSDLVPGTTYYWRIDEVNDLHPTKLWPGEVWSFTVIPPTAADPAPADGQIFVDPSIALSWTPGPLADKHDVYLGSDFDSVNNATRTDHPGLLSYSENQDANSYPDAGNLSLDYGKTYYWRIDEVNDTDTWTGDVWSFTTMDFGGGVMLGDWEQTMDGWFSWKGTTSYSDTGGVTSGNYSLRQELLPESGYMIELSLTEVPGGVDAFFANNVFSIDVTRLASDWSGNGTSAVTFVVEGEGDGWHNYGNANSTWSPSNGDSTMTLTWDYSDSLSLVAADPSTLRMIIWQDSSNFTGNGVYYYDNARFSTPVLASNPFPRDAATEVDREPTLSWTPGRFAVLHDVYFGNDYDNVRDANRANVPAGVQTSIDQPETTYIPGVLDFQTTYYWKINEVNDPDILEGNVWSFTVGNYLTVDNFEDYNNFSPDRVFQKWLDGTGYSSDPYYPGGYGGNGTNAAVGHDIWTTTSPYYNGQIMETSIVNTGSRQSMPLYFDNTVTPFVSRTDCVFDSAQDWTILNAETLSIWTRGISPYMGSFSYNQATGIYTMTGAGADIWGTSDQFHFAYKSLSRSGYIQAQVLSIANTVDPNSTDGWAKAGVMIRETLNPDSTFAIVCVTPANGSRFQARLLTAEEATSDTDVATEEQIATAAPYWVKLERNVSSFNGYYSANNTVWTPIAWNPQDISMSVDVYIGLALTSHMANVQAAAEFSGVQTVGTDGTVTGNWQSQDIGIQNNPKEPLYAVIADSDSDILITNPDPNIVITNTWQRWDIDLASQIEAQGVALQDIQSLSIGVGDPDATSAAGSGIIYVDDVRLHLPEP